jgi:hypothetical protein
MRQSIPSSPPCCYRIVHFCRYCWSFCNFLPRCCTRIPASRARISACTFRGLKLTAHLPAVQSPVSPSQGMPPLRTVSLQSMTAFAKNRAPPANSFPTAPAWRFYPGLSASRPPPYPRQDFLNSLYGPLLGIARLRPRRARLRPHNGLFHSLAEIKIVRFKRSSHVVVRPHVSLPHP